MTEPLAATLTPPTGSPTLRPSFIDLTADAASVAIGRRFTRDVISGHIRDADHAHTVVLLASELVTNAYTACHRLVLDGLFRAWRHYHRPIRLGIIATDRYVHLAVTDPDTRPLEPAAPEEDGDLLECGRGLAIVAEFGAAWWPSYNRYDKAVHVVIPAPGVELSGSELAALGWRP